MCVREEARYTIVLAFTTLPYQAYLLYCTPAVPDHRASAMLISGDQTTGCSSVVQVRRAASA